MTSKMKVAQASKPGGDFELVERDIPEPGTGQVRVKVEACGICHSDALVKEGLWPGLQYPRVPGHEVAGHIDAIGSGVTNWKKGQRVGVGWHGGHDFVCEQCRRGEFAMCINRKVTGIDFDGGYAEYVIAPAAALAGIPDELPAEEAGPFMCAVGTTERQCAVVDYGETIRLGLLFRHCARFARHVGIQCLQRRPSHDREISAQSGGRRLRTNAQRQGAFPGRSHYAIKNFNSRSRRRYK